jgi:predicted nucleic acid-binding protein
VAVSGWVLDKSAATALHHGLGVLHVDGDFERIAEVRPLVVRRLG